MSTPKIFSQACENNRQPILDLLLRFFAKTNHVLEVGSGTGQHAAFFAPRLPHLVWQTSDLTANHAIINAWIDDCPSSNNNIEARGLTRAKLSYGLKLNL